MIDIGPAIRRRREAKGFSQLDLALAIGYKNGGDISRVETGKQWPDPAKLAAIAKELGCPVSALFEEAEGGKPQEHYDAGTRRVSELVVTYDSTARPAQSWVERGDPPTLDDALTDVQHMLTGGDNRELLAAIAYQGMMTRYATTKIVDTLNSLVQVVERLQETAEKKGGGMTQSMLSPAAPIPPAPPAPSP